MKITPRGRSPNLPLNNTPYSGWRLANAWATWEVELPNAYVYRLRAVDPQGSPLHITRKRGTDVRGLLYVGETGIKDNDPSHRLEKLAQGVTNQGTGDHCGAKTYWQNGWDKKLASISPKFVLEVGWDKQTDFTMPAAKNEALPAAAQKDQMITNTGKGLVMGLEDAMLWQYEPEYGELPPLNSARSPGLRNRDRKSKHNVSDDLTDRDHGDVEMA
jgi:hypothetical protein